MTSERARGAALFIGLMLAVTLLSWLLLRRSIPAPPIHLPQAAACQTVPAFEVRTPDAPGNVTRAGQAGFDFLSTGWVEGHPCGAGTLLIDAEGQEAGGHAPTLTVSMNSRQLAALEFSARRTVRLDVREGGLLTLGYFNDYYRSNLRLVFLEDLHMSGSSCQTVSVRPPHGGSWDITTETASLLYSAPLIIYPCQAGVLIFRLWGTEANGSFARVEFRQADLILDNRTAGRMRQPIKLSVGSGPVAVRILNPYANQLEDRNLKVHSIRFIPAGP